MSDNSEAPEELHIEEVFLWNCSTPTTTTVFRNISKIFKGTSSYLRNSYLVCRKITTHLMIKAKHEIQFVDVNYFFYAGT